VSSRSGTSAVLPTVQSDQVMAQSGAENFPVAPFILPRAVRRHLLAIYGFARLTDEIGDEVDGDRLAQLDWLDAEVTRSAEGKAEHPVMVRLTPTITELGLSLQPMRDLIEANRQDQRIAGYKTFDDLVGYCMLSAAPVGRLVLEVFRAATPDRIALSDNVCVALQIVEHLQDVREDAERGRVYLPRLELDAAGVTDHELTADQASSALRRVVAVQAARSRRLLGSGRALATMLPFRPALAVRGFTGGGLAVLDALVAARFDVLAVACRPRRDRVLRHVLVPPRSQERVAV